MKNKKVKNYVMAFLMPIIIFLVIASLTSHVPFGKYLFNYIDSYKMYPSLLIHSIRSLKTGEIFYNLHSAFGTDFYNMRTLYMNSPFNLLFIFFKEENVFVFYTLLMFLRVGLSGLTMCIFLNSISKEKYSWKQVLFSLIYALSSFGVACSVHIMWMDSFLLLPLIIMSLNKLILEKKSTLYVVLLSLAILINFYLGFMICIFCLIYFVYKSYIEEKINFDNIKRFIISSLFCGLIAGVIIIPQIFSLVAGRGSEFDASALFGISTYSLFSIPVSLTTGSYLHIDNFRNGSPLIYCTIFILVWNIFYYFNKKITKREKKATLILTIFFFLSLFVNVIDYTWNMFQEPIWWAHRYSFVITFFMIMIGFISFDKIKSLKIDYVKSILFILVYSILVILSFTLKTVSFEVPKYYIWGLIISLILFVLYFNLYKEKNYKYIIVFCILFEIIYNGFCIYKENSLITVQDSKDYLGIREVVDELKEYDNNFYRVAFPDAHPDDSLLYNVYSGDLFGSSYDSSFRDFLYKKINFTREEVNTIYMENYNPAILSLLGYKYVIGNSDYYDYTLDNVYYNDDYLSVGFVVPQKIIEQDLVDGEYFINIEKIYSSLIGEEIELFDNPEIIDYKYMEQKDDFGEIISTANYSFEAEKDGFVLLSNIKMSSLFATIRVNDKVVSPSRTKERFDGIVYVKKGDIVEVEFMGYKEQINKYEWKFSLDEIRATFLDSEKFEKAITELKNYQQMTDISTKGHVISGKFKSSEGTLFLSIPYSDQFTIKVDGEKVEYYKIFDSFMGIAVEDGEHEITIDYLPKGLILGVFISVISFIGAIIYLKLDKYFIVNNKNNVKD